MPKFRYIGEGKFLFKGNEYRNGEIIETDEGILPVNLFREVIMVKEAVKPKIGGR